MRETLVRTATALVLLALAWAWFFAAPEGAFRAGAALLAGLLWAEGARFLGLSLWPAHGLAGAAVAASVWGAPAEAALAGGGLALALALAERRAGGAPAVVFAQGWLAAAAAALAALLVQLHPQAAGRGWLLGAAFGVWAADTAAYFAGRAFGGPRLAPAVSPGKTWSGLAAGLLAGALVAAGWWVRSGLASAPRALVAAFVLLAAAVLGDLAVSAAKRLAGVKDAGRWLPGHGGLWDRLDALAFALPIGWSTWRLAAS